MSKDDVSAGTGGLPVGGGVGRVIGATIGRAIDDRAIAGLGPARQIGPRLETLKVQGTAEGAPMACLFGRARVTGQVIWAARFLERGTFRQAPQPFLRPAVEQDRAALLARFAAALRRRLAAI